MFTGGPRNPIYRVDEKKKTSEVKATSAEFEKLTVSTRQLAGCLAMSSKAVAEHALRGHLKRVAHGRFSLAESLRLFTTHQRTVASAHGGPGTASLKGERLRLVRLQADRVEHRLQRESGDLLSKSDVVAEVGALIRQVRARLLALPTRIANACALDRVVTAAIDAEIREILTELADSRTYAGFELPADAEPRRRVRK